MVAEIVSGGTPPTGRSGLATPPGCSASAAADTRSVQLKNIGLFVSASLIGGAGGLLGSILGNAFGKSGLFAGGFIGGVLLAPATAWLSRRMGWIAPARFWHVAAGAAAGFVAAATLAINTLSSPVGPAIATTLTGLGAIAGARLGND